MPRSALISGDGSIPMVDHAKGVYIVDTDGKRYLDGSGGAMTVSIGHGVDDVVEAMHRQACAVSFVTRGHFRNAPAEELANVVTELAPAGVNHAFFVNSGSEANELAMRTALAHWRGLGKPGKTRILGRQISYHGATMGALSMSGHAGRRALYGDLLHTFAVAPPPYDYRFPLDGADGGNHGAAVWDRILAEQDPDTVAAVIVEPIVGAAGGALTPPIGYLGALRAICDKHDVLLIVDEVITGFGRTGQWFACQHDDVAPDMITCGKGMTSGYTPMGAILFHDRLVEGESGARQSIPFGHTFSNNPLGAATCLAVIRHMQAHDVLANVADRGQQLESGLHALAARHPWVADVRGRGLLRGFELVDDAATRAPPDPARCANQMLARLCFEAGLIVYAAGFAPFNNAIILAPPLTITEAELADLLARLDQGLAAYGRTLSAPVVAAPQPGTRP